MKKIVLTVSILFILLLAFTGCQVKADILPDEEILSAEARSFESRGGVKPQDIGEVSVTLFRQIDNPPTQDMGQSFHHKTLEEQMFSLGVAYGTPYIGAISAPEWSLIDGKQVVMSNVTNYNLDENTGELWGSNHSEITIVDLATGGPVLTLQANGTIKGSLFGAEIDMNWVIVEDYGNDVKGTGKINGTFAWFFAADDPFGGWPRGTFALSGSIR